MIVAKGISLRLVGISCLPALAACMCDLGVAVKFPADVSRKWLLQQKNPVLIKGITKSWPALSGWKLENLGRLHGDVAYRTDPWGGNISLSRFINNEFSADYYMGHVVQYGDCYLQHGREYSPFLQTRGKKDYHIPEMFQPMKTFQIGMGHGRGIGVAPEHHPPAWFAVVAGRKRWVLTPGEQGKEDEPPITLTGKVNGECEPSNLPSNALVCDQGPGDIMWVPDQWWHETCGLDNWTIGIGGVTYEGAENFDPVCSEDHSFTQGEMEKATAECHRCLKNGKGRCTDISVPVQQGTWTVPLAWCDKLPTPLLPMPVAEKRPDTAKTIHRPQPASSWWLLEAGLSGMVVGAVLVKLRGAGRFHNSEKIV